MDQQYERNQWGHGEHCSCICDVCVGSTSSCTKFYGLINMCMPVLCLASKESTFHSLKCLEGKCDSCGIDMLITYPIEEEKLNNKLMTWKYYEKVVHGKTRVGVDNKILRLQYKKPIIAEFISYTKSKLCKFILQYFVVRFQKE